MEISARLLYNTLAALRGRFWLCIPREIDLLLRTADTFGSPAWIFQASTGPARASSPPAGLLRRGGHSYKRIRRLPRIRGQSPGSRCNLDRGWAPDSHARGARGGFLGQNAVHTLGAYRNQKIIAAREFGHICCKRAADTRPIRYEDYA